MKHHQLVNKQVGTGTQDTNNDEDGEVREKDTMNINIEQSHLLSGKMTLTVYKLHPTKQFTMIV